MDREKPRCDECGDEAVGVTDDGTLLCEDCALEAPLDLEDLLALAFGLGEKS
jgi:hypothetical protein